MGKRDHTEDKTLNVMGVTFSGEALKKKVLVQIKFLKNVAMFTSICVSIGKILSICKF